MTKKLYLVSTNEAFTYLGADLRVLKVHLIDDAYDAVWINQNAFAKTNHDDWLNSFFDGDLLKAVQNTSFTQVYQLDDTNISNLLREVNQPCIDLSTNHQYDPDLKQMADHLKASHIVFDSDQIQSRWLDPSFTLQMAAQQQYFQIHRHN